MGALATLAPWIPEDDLLLKNAVEAGASLESLAKGAVQFSRKYSIREIQDRWYSLLYDPVISAEASARMTNFELSASPLPPKFYSFGHSKEKKAVSAKKKSESVRNLYYARRKRIRNNVLTSMDLSFLVDPGNGNYAVNGNEPLSENCLPEVVLKEEHQILGDNVPLSGAVEDFDVPKELAIDGWIGDDNLERVPLPTLDHINNDAGNMCSEFDENNGFDSPELECGTSFNLSPFPEMPVWRTDESIQEPDITCDVFNDTMACGEAYLEELSNSLFNFSSEEELLLMDVDGREGIDKSYYDGLSSLLQTSSNDVNPDQIPKKDEIEISGGVQSSSSGVLVVYKLEFQMPSSASAKDSQFPELIIEPSTCTLNAEYQEIPSNDDVFLPFDVPPVIFPPSTKSTFKESNKPISSSVQDYGFTKHRASERGSPCFPGPVGGSKVKYALLHPNKKEATNVGLANDPSNHVASSFIKKSTVNSDDFRNHPQPNGSIMKIEQDLALPLQDHLLQHAEVGPSGVLESELVVNPPTLDEEEEYIESDDELPSYSDVEAMVLDMDLDPDDHQDLFYNEEVSRYQHVESKRAIMRLEQGAHSCIQRAINSHGAFAILYGRHSKHYIKKPEVLLGRATEGVPVDIDLGKGGQGNAISRRQAIIKMDKDGSFYIKNFGKSSILVNSKEVLTGQSQKLHSNYLIEVRGMPLIFEINQTRVKQYLDHISDNSQTL
uniref:Microspherule protein 1 n=1 Tax=Cajanus cajan TaxID=3821 RepID=A0A151RQL8_CAJCA|nr:Microspherule protein 1 [Cajanus cajan]